MAHNRAKQIVEALLVCFRDKNLNVKVLMIVNFSVVNNYGLQNGAISGVSQFQKNIRENGSMTNN